MKRSAIFLSLAPLLVGASPAQAHLMNSGFGPFYDGLAHPFLVPEDLLLVLALTLLAGLRGARCGRWVVFALPLAWLLGMTAAGAIHLPAGPGWLTSALTIALGALVAADRPWPLPVVTGLAVLAGTAHGFGNGRELAALPGGGLAMAGIVCALFVFSALIAGQVATLQAHWARVAARVAGSWIAAIGLLMFGWSLRAGP